MNKMFNMFLMLSVIGSASAFAGPIFQDNKGLLYCEMVCRVGPTEVKEGTYNKNAAGHFSRVKGQWEKVGYTGLLGASYSVDASVFKAIHAKCQEKREQLLNMPTIRGLIEDGSFSGVTERSCKVFPRITTDAGARSYEVKAIDDSENEL